MLRSAKSQSKVRPLTLGLCHKIVFVYKIFFKNFKCVQFVRIFLFAYQKHFAKRSPPNDFQNIEVLFANRRVVRVDSVLRVVKLLI
jgi:hypothetical protein